MAFKFVEFPPASEADDDGLLAVGGSLSPDYLISAYSQGVFPWFSDEGVPFWFSLDPRMVLKIENFRFSKSLGRVVKSGRFEVRIDTCFRDVMLGCASADVRASADGTWITDDFVEGYTRMHELGLAHSFETFQDGKLVGGLYGLSFGAMFSGESMFHRVTDASKVAFVELVAFCRRNGLRLIDAQQPTKHLASLGATPVPRTEFLEMLNAAVKEKTLAGLWTNM